MDNDTQTSQPTEAELQAEELARLRKIAEKFTPLGEIAEALERDPSKYYAVQQALQGNANPIQQQVQQVAQNQRLTPEQIEYLNQRAITNPAETMAEIAMLAARQAQAETMQQANPLLGTTGALLVDSFKARKAGSDDLYKQIAPLFDRQMGDVNRTGLINMSEAAREREMELRWQSAAAEVFRRAAATKKNDPPPLSGGGNAPTAPVKTGVFSRELGISALAQRLGLTDEEMQDIEKSLEEDNS